MLLDSRSRLAAGPTEAVVAAAGQIILGKERQIRLAMACILARGHLLPEKATSFQPKPSLGAIMRSLRDERREP